MANVLPFNDANLTSNDFLLMDTSFILAYSGYDTLTKGRADLVPRKMECNNLISKIIDADAMFAISTVTYEELLSIIQRDFFKQNQCPTESDKKRLRSLDPDKYSKIIQMAMDETNNYIMNLKKINNYYPDIVGNTDYMLLQLANDIQNKYQIHGLQDAKQIAIAIKEKFTHYVTVDHDFNNVNCDQLQILVDKNTFNNT